MAELIAEHLGKEFGAVHAITDVSFELDGKGCFGYLGPNGAGKTTTMKLFTSLLKPSQGRALVNGFDVVEQPSAALKEVGSLIEDPEPYPFMTVMEFIEFAVRVRGAGKQVDFKGLNERLTLPPFDRRCSKLSKGQKRRVYLAALLAQDPGILLLDEPSAGLDPAESVVFRSLILQLKEEKMVFLSSHLLNEVAQICDKVMFINKGKIVETGSVREISRRFASKQLRVEFENVVREQNLATPALKQLLTGYRKEGANTYVLAFDGRDGTRKAIVDELHRMGIRSVSDAQLGLEEAYMDLMS